MSNHSSSTPLFPATHLSPREHHTCNFFHCGFSILSFLDHVISLLISLSSFPPHSEQELKSLQCPGVICLLLYSNDNKSYYFPSCPSLLSSFTCQTRSCLRAFSLAALLVNNTLSPDIRCPTPFLYIHPMHGNILPLHHPTNLGFLIALILTYCVCACVVCLPPLEYKLCENRGFLLFTNNGVLWTVCYGLCTPPPNSYIEALPPCGRLYWRWGL